MSVTLIEAGLTELLISPAGPVSRNVTEKAEAVAEAARQNVMSRFNTRSGNLLNSIGVFPEESADGLQCEVGTDGAPYGLVLEQGGEPHLITPIAVDVLRSRPDNPDPLLSPQTQVYHPGPIARPWLQPALEQVFTGG